MSRHFATLFSSPCFTDFIFAIADAPPPYAYYFAIDIAAFLRFFAADFAAMLFRFSPCFTLDFRSLLPLSLYAAAIARLRYAIYARAMLIVIAFIVCCALCHAFDA